MDRSGANEDAYPSVRDSDRDFGRRIHVPAFMEVATIV